jgi:hypothetical protein
VATQYGYTATPTSLVLYSMGSTSTPVTELDFSIAGN